MGDYKADKTHDDTSPAQTYPRDGLAQELGNPKVAVLPYGHYDQGEEDEEEDDE